MAKMTMTSPAVVLGTKQAIIDTWPGQIEEHTTLSYALLHGPNKNTSITLDRDVYLLNYHGLKWFLSAAAKGYFKPRKYFFIFDESSMLKDPSSHRYAYVKKFLPWMTKARLLLTATPNANGWHQLWSQAYLLDNGNALGKTYTAFKQKYFNESGPPFFRITPKPGAIEAIINKLGPLCYRIEGSEGPDIVNTYHNVELPTDIRRLYDQLEEDFVTVLPNGKEYVAHSENALTGKLRQMIQGAVYTHEEFEGEYVTLHKAKLEALADLIEGLNGNPALIMINFKFEIDMIRKYLKKDIPVVNSATPDKLKSQYFKQWNAGELPLLMGNPKSMGHGLNLQHGGHHVICYSIDWDLDYHMQFIGRLARPGQVAKRVFVHYILAKATRDQVVLEDLKRKENELNLFLNSVKEMQHGRSTKEIIKKTTRRNNKTSARDAFAAIKPVR